MNHELAYVLTATDMNELEEIISLLQHIEDTPAFPAVARRALVERLNLLSLRLKACPELRKLPLVPRIPNVEPLTTAEINELNKFKDLLHIYPTLPLRAAMPQDEDGYDLCDWNKAYLLIQRATPNDLSMYIACLRRILQFTDGGYVGYEAINVYLGVRVVEEGKSEPVGWLENGMLFKSKEGNKFFLAGIQRTLSAIPEFHS